MEKMKKNNDEEERILLMVMPFWDPLIPPMGISCLKGFLQGHGFGVHAVDTNVEEQFKECYDDYFKVLKEAVPASRRSHFYNIGKEVLRNHMMVYLNGEDGEENGCIVKELIFKHFYSHVNPSPLHRLDKIMARFYQRLNRYVLELIEREKPTVLGLSVYKGSTAASLFAFKRVKEQYPHIKTIMGGGIFTDELAVGSPNLSTLLEKASFIDKIIIGEGEGLFLKLLQHRLPQWQRVYTLQDIGGETVDISSARLPDFSDFKLRHYPYLAAYSSRSCPYQCSFCSETVLWGKYRRKSAAQVLKELTELKNLHDSQLFLLTDSLLNPIVTELAHEVFASSAPIYWDGYLKIDSRVCDRETVMDWRRGGFYRARLGVESGSPRILDLMKKGVTPAQIKTAIINLADAGIKTTTYWVMGYPGETEEDFGRTLDLVEELKDDIYEADCNAFAYFYTGQVNSGEWADKRYLLYSKQTADRLNLQTHDLDCEPSREERFARMRRFIHHCQQLGIPNPYSLLDICYADERWKRRHRNAVPALVDFNHSSACIDECREARQLNIALNKHQEKITFNF